MTGWKTVAFNALLAAWGVVETADVTAVLGEGNASWVVMGVGIIGMILRGMTNTPIFKKA
jgi:hypothetical protein